MFLAQLSFAQADAASGWAIVPTPAGSNSPKSLDGVTCVSAADCWAVGNDYSTSRTQTLVQRWNGTSWSNVPSANTSPTGHNALTSVTCTSSSDCWAVGAAVENEVPRTLIQRWNGSSWSIVPSPNAGPKANGLYDVTCSSASDCWAVGYYEADAGLLKTEFRTLIQRWNGSAWSIVESPNLPLESSRPIFTFSSNVLRSVTCTSATDCWAVGYGNGKTMVQRWNGTSWSLVDSPNTDAPNGDSLFSVTCASPSDCWAVGSSALEQEGFTLNLIMRWNGSAWSLVPSPNTGDGSYLNAVTCVSAAECWAAGTYYQSASGKGLTLVQKWNGTSWATVATPNPMAASQTRFHDLTCSSTDECWAVGYTSATNFARTLIERYTRADVAPAGAAQLQNISTRLRVQTGDNVMIGGFIVTGTAPKRVILRAIGPSLSAGGSPAAGRMLDPTLELNDNSGARVAFNDNWKDSPERAEIEASGIPPGDDREAAIARTLPPGNYTATVRGAGESTGIALVEAYDIDAPADSRLANISTRGFVETGDNVMIGGLIVGPSDRDNTRMLVRAIGPSLAARGVAGALQDPTIALHDANGALLAANDNWKESQRAEIEGTGIPPGDDRESAIVRVLAPGLYTAIVRGQGNSTGVALVEAYNLGSP